MNTPKTDASCGWPWGHHGRSEYGDLMHWSPDGPFVHSSVARELERENAALRNEIARLNSQTMWICSCGGTDCAGQKENAALREAKDAYFKHNNVLVELMTKEQKEKALEILVSRRKEAKP